MLDILCAVPINDGRHIDHATGNLDVGDVGTPDMISMANIKSSELIDVLLVFFDWDSGIGLFNSQYSF